jgi:hypothetical protein
MYNAFVRTTIEIKREHRAKLLQLAARRGEKGFSPVVAEALEAYFQADGERERLRRRALRLRGTLPKAEIEPLQHDTKALRGFWR